MKCSTIFLTLLATSAWADEVKQPRTLGNTAVLHVYYYAPQVSRGDVRGFVPV